MSNKTVCGCVIQKMVSIYSALTINNTMIASDWCNSNLTRCWRASIWSIVGVIKGKNCSHCGLLCYQSAAVVWSWGCHGSGISIPLSVLMLSSWSFKWIVSFALQEYQWGSRQISLASSYNVLCPVLLLRSELAEVWVRDCCMSL